MPNKVAIELKEHFEERLLRNLTDEEIAFVSWIAEKTYTPTNDLDLLYEK